MFCESRDQKNNIVFWIKLHQIMDVHLKFSCGDEDKDDYDEDDAMKISKRICEGWLK